MSEAEDNLNLYLERYCAKHECTQEEALTHAMIQEVKRYYEEESRK